MMRSASPRRWGGSATVSSRIASDDGAITLILADGAWQNPDATLGIRLAELEAARPLRIGT